MAKEEDVLHNTYQYAWSAKSDISLEEFLTKYKPSMVQNDGTKPWIWVRGNSPYLEDKDTAAATEEASEYLKEVTEQVQSIANDPSIPTRSNKKTGAKSKKELREKVQAEAREKLEEISVRHGYVSGKWLIFASSANVDMIWSKLATSLVSGPLASTPALLAKVATSPEEENPNYQHVICVYMPNVYDKEAVTEVMKVLLRNHGMNLTGVKSDLYTAVGIDSKHPSGVSSTVWKNTALLKDTEIKELKQTFFVELEAAKANTVIKPVPSSTDDTTKDSATVATSKPKPRPKKKVMDDPFASDSGNESDEEPKKNAETKSKLKKPVAANSKRAKDSDDEDQSSEEERPKKKRTTTKK